MRALRIVPPQPLAALTMVAIFGIVNVTHDSFSDGGRFLAPEAAIAQARRLLDDGADVVDVGAESTHPDAEDVPAEEEIRRLVPVVTELVRGGASVSVDTHKPAVMRAMIERGVHWLNDVRGFRSPDAMAAVAAAPAHVRFVVMFSKSQGARAERGVADPAVLMDELHAFATERVQAFRGAGIGKERLVLDPGMGFFLGGVEPSLRVLRHLPELGRHGMPVLVSVSRKGFLGTITGRPVPERGPATLAAELWAIRHGASFVRTHDAAALRAAIAVERAIDGSP